MKKQYVLSKLSTFRYLITTYHDGVVLQRDKVWEDDLFDAFTKLEEAGYEQAYTWPEIQKAKEQYERLLARQLVKEASHE